jgi:hypothetical protein
VVPEHGLRGLDRNYPARADEKVGRLHVSRRKPRAERGSRLHFRTAGHVNEDSDPSFPKSRREIIHQSRSATAREEIRRPERGRKWFRLALADKISLSSELPAASFLV